MIETSKTLKSEKTITYRRQGAHPSIAILSILRGCTDPLLYLPVAGCAYSISVVCTKYAPDGPGSGPFKAAAFGYYVRPIPATNYCRAKHLGNWRPPGFRIVSVLNPIRQYYNNMTPQFHGRIISRIRRLDGAEIVICISIYRYTLQDDKIPVFIRTQMAVE